MSNNFTMKRNNQTIHSRRAGVRSGPDGGAGVVQEVPAVRQCQGPDSGLGPVLSCVQTHIQTTASGKRKTWHYNI